MQIQLKQGEIVTALRNYVSQQGINLLGKDVAITFTAGRKETGISADISIESYINDVDEPDTPYAMPLTKEGVISILGTPTEPANEPEVPVVREDPVELTVEETPKTTSLFG